MTQRKPKTENSIPHHITLPPVLAAKSAEFLRKSGYSGLSDYVQEKLRRDIPAFIWSFSSQVEQPKQPPAAQ